ncbi:MAG: hypothetical protein CME65_01295 [Halobacteriovoraceae bacterium]|nr:hypothetical protein [Halobacteriovoraceae bacterium]|tara:strand:+ start:5536 stop:6378 length:843 start_codon:yes stop_codon:yes gene_type:complete
MSIILSILTLPLLFSSPKKLACEPQQKTLRKKGIEVKIESYQSFVSGDPIVIFPPTGGKNKLDQLYAKGLCSKGRKVVIMEEWTGYGTKKTDLGVHNRYYRNAVNALKLVHKEELAGKEFGVLGTSLGGIFTAISLHQIPQINKAFIIASGIDLPEMIVTSRHNDMKDLKTFRLKTYKFSSEREYIKALRKEIPLEPTNNPIDFKSKKLGQYIIAGDQIVPERNQIKLNDLWKPDLVRKLEPSLISKLNGKTHKSGIIKAYFHYSNEVINFFLTDKKRKR